MIVGAGHLQLPAYACARQLGLRIVAIDKNAQAPGMRLADAAFPIDTRDREGAIAIAQAESVAGVITLCTDYPVRTVAAVSEALGLPGLSPTSALWATHKGLMRERFRIAGAPSPGFARVASEAEALRALEALGLPAIVKPAASSGSRGVYKVTEIGEAARAFRHAASIDGTDTEVIVEQFIDGPEVSVEAVSSSGACHVIAITDKVTTGDPHWVETGHSQPSRLPEAQQSSIRDCVAAGLDALGINDCVSHVEIKVSRMGPQLIEVGARLGGDFISTELTLRSSGVDMVRCAIDIALGRQPDVTRRCDRGSAIQYITPSPGRVTAISGLEEARSVPGVDIIDVYVKEGDLVRATQSSTDRSGHIITSGQDAMDAKRAVREALALLRIVTRPEAHE